MTLMKTRMKLLSITPSQPLRWVVIWCIASLSQNSVTWLVIGWSLRWVISTFFVHLHHFGFPHYRFIVFEAAVMFCHCLSCTLMVAVISSGGDMVFLKIFFYFLFCSCSSFYLFWGIVDMVLFFLSFTQLFYFLQDKKLPWLSFPSWFEMVIQDFHTWQHPPLVTNKVKLIYP